MYLVCSKRPRSPPEVQIRPSFDISKLEFFLVLLRTRNPPRGTGYRDFLTVRTGIWILLFSPSIVVQLLFIILIVVLLFTEQQNNNRMIPTFGCPILVLHCYFCFAYLTVLAFFFCSTWAAFVPF